MTNILEHLAGSIVIMTIYVDGVEQKRTARLERSAYGTLRYVPTLNGNERLAEYVDGEMQIHTVVR